MVYTNGSNSNALTIQRIVQQKEAYQEKAPAQVMQEARTVAQGPSFVEQQAQKAESEESNFILEIKNTDSTNSQNFVLFDAYGTYAALNTFSKDVSVVITPKNFLYDQMLQEIKTGYRFLITQVIYTVTAGTATAQFTEVIQPFTHQLNVRQSRLLKEILPAQEVDMYAQRQDVKMLNVGLIVDGAFALKGTLKPSTTVSMEFKVIRIL